MTTATTEFRCGPDLSTEESYWIRAGDAGQVADNVSAEYLSLLMAAPHLLEACRSALYILRNDATESGKFVAAELRAALREVDSAYGTARHTPTTALSLCLTEIEQFHSKAYPDCDGGCPAHEAMNAARAFLKREE